MGPKLLRRLLSTLSPHFIYYTYICRGGPLSQTHYCKLPPVPSVASEDISTTYRHFFHHQVLFGTHTIMKLLLFNYLLASLFALTILAVAPQKAVLVSYPKDTPDWVMDQAKDTIRKAGGMITHEYKLIK